jgi:hypothetical protein
MIKTASTDGIESPSMNPTQNQFSLNCAASKKQFPISFLAKEALANAFSRWVIFQARSKVFVVSVCKGD